MTSKLSMTLLCGLLTVSAQAQAGFDWGADCESGEGDFAQNIAYQRIVDVGDIPTNKRNVRITLNSPVDTDIQLYDKATGHAIIAWPGGDLNGATSEETEYRGVTYRYSGYNGVNGNKGHEYIEIIGDTNRALEMKAFGYRSGQADVTYSWSAVPTCNEIGDGSFSQFIPNKDTISVGKIPAHKTGVVVELTAANGRDVDVQLVNAATGEEIIAWPNGILNGANVQETEYQGMTIRYSGYNGINGNWGHEKIEIAGRVTTELEMRAYGYAAGNAVVDYSWGQGVGQLCGTRGAAFCAEGLTCKWGNDWELAAVDHPGQCHTELWCESDESAAKDCENVMHVATPGHWTCEEFTCNWASDLPSQCGAPRDGYTQIYSPDAVSDHAGQAVQLTWSATPSQFAMCTKMACSEHNPCCNSCSAPYEFNDVRLYTASGSPPLGCSGNECNYQDSCTYGDEAMLTVYGTVSDDGNTVVVDEHCVGAELGCGMYGPSCPSGYTCQDMGCPVINGEVAPCINPQGTCAPEAAEPPSLVVAPPVDGTHAYAPMETINACVHNNLNESIFLSGCSNFALQNEANGNTTPDIVCVWEGYAKEVAPGESLCSNGGLRANEPGTYHVNSGYALGCETGKPLSQANCSSHTELSSETLSVRCPKSVDCMPVVDPEHAGICGALSAFAQICPQTGITH